MSTGHLPMSKAGGGGLVDMSCLTVATPWTVCSLPGSLSMGISRQEYWSELPFPSPGDVLGLRNLNVHESNWSSCSGSTNTKI